jgi:hypothetical protein
LEPRRIRGSATEPVSVVPPGSWPSRAPVLRAGRSPGDRAPRHARRLGRRWSFDPSFNPPGPVRVAWARAQRNASPPAHVHLTDPRPPHCTPAYLRHVKVIVTPHRVTPFTASLDPTTAHECLATVRPAMATPPTAPTRRDAGFALCAVIHPPQRVARRRLTPEQVEGCFCRHDLQEKGRSTDESVAACSVSRISRPPRIGRGQDSGVTSAGVAWFSRRSQPERARQR